MMLGRIFIAEMRYVYMSFGQLLTLD